MRIRDFGVEIWMNRWETSCRYNLAETCVDSVTVEELLAIAGLDGAALLEELAPMRLGWFLYRRTRTAVRQGRIDRCHCPSCGYNAKHSILRGRCPECGSELYERPEF